MAQPTQGLSSSASASLASRPMDQDSPTGIAKKKLKKSVDENKEKENNVKVNKDKDDNKDQKKNKDGSEVPKEKKKKVGKPRSATHDGVESSIISPQGNWDSKSANNYHKVDQFYWSHEHNNWFSSTSGPPPPSGGAGETDEVNKYDVDIWDGNSAEQAQGKSDPNLTEEKEEVNVSKNSLTFVTWNVWFGYRTEDVAALKPRLTGLFEIIAKLEPDFVCLQEVTHPISVILRLHPYFQQKGYWMSDPSLIKDTAYGIMMISKLPIIELCQITLPTKLGRYCLLAKTRLNDEIIGVLTCHWESLDQNVEFRRKQWQIIYSVMEGEEELPGNKSSASSPNKTKIDHAFIMGDCNFANQKERKELIIKRYEDLWKNFNKKKRKSKKKTPKSERIDKSSDATEEQEKSKDVSKKDKDKNGKDSKRSKKDGANKNDPKGFTFDPERNRMLKKIIESGNETVWKRERVDVILCKSKKWKSEHVQLLGTEPLAGVKQLVHQKKKSTADGQDSATTAYDEVYPSDHFGLHGRYVWKKDGAGIGVDSPKLTK